MALEYKTLNADNDEADDIVNIHASFGWELQNSQRVFEQDTHLEFSHYDANDNKVYDQVTETTDFTKLVFKREKNAANYDEVVSLENNYYAAIQRIEELQDDEARADKIMAEHNKKCDLRSNFSKKFHHIAMAFCIGCLLLAALASSLMNVNIVFSLILPLCACIGLFGTPISIWREIASKENAYIAFRANLGSNDNPYFKRYLELRKEYLDKNPDIAKLVNGSDERLAEIRRLRSQATNAMSKAEHLL